MLGLKLNLGVTFTLYLLKCHNPDWQPRQVARFFYGDGGRFGLTRRKLSLILLFVIVPIFFAKKIIIAVFYFENNGLKQSEV